MYTYVCTYTYTDERWPDTNFPWKPRSVIPKKTQKIADMQHFPDVFCDGILFFYFINNRTCHPLGIVFMCIASRVYETAEVIDNASVGLSLMNRSYHNCYYCQLQCYLVI